jgi:hypothetical protein
MFHLLNDKGDNSHLTLSYNDCNGDRNFPCIPVLMSLYHNIFLGTVLKALRMSMNDTSVDCLAIFLSLILFSGHPGISVNELSPLSKLIKTGIHGKFLSPLQSLYDNVKCAVKVNDCLTPWLEVDTGVKQG